MYSARLRTDPILGHPFRSEMLDDPRPGLRPGHLIPSPAFRAEAPLPDFDIVLNHGDLPILRKKAGKPPFYGPTDFDARVAAPLFSICSSEDFWDILFPNVCRPALVNMSSMSAVPWSEKKAVAFWRGTDRGGCSSESERRPKVVATSAGRSSELGCAYRSESSMLHVVTAARSSSGPPRVGRQEGSSRVARPRRPLF